METIAQISTAELIDIVSSSEHSENKLAEIRRIIENEYPTHAYRLIADLLFIKETYEQRYDRELREKKKAEEAEAFRRQQEAGKLKTVSVPEYMGTGEYKGQQEE